MSVSRLVFILRCYQKSNWSNVWHSSSSVSLSRESPVSSDWIKASICRPTILEDPDPDELFYSLLSGESFRLREASHWHLHRKTPAGKKVFQKLGWFFSHCFCGTFWSSVAWGLDCPWVVRLWWGDADGCLTNRSVVLWIINPTDLRANGSLYHWIIATMDHWYIGSSD